MKSKILLFGLVMLLSRAVFAQAQVSKAEQLLRQDKPQEALTELRKAVASNPKNFDAWVLLGEVFLLTDQPDSALFAGRQARDIDGKNPAGYVITSRAEAAKKDFKSAYNSVRNGLKSSKSNNSNLLVQLGNLHMAMDSTDQAFVAFSQAQVANAKNAAAYEGLAEVYMKKGSAGMAILQLENFVKIDTSNAEAYQKLADIYLRERRYTEAARTYNRVVALDTTKAAPLFEMARLYFLGKQYVNASRALQLYVRRFPENKEGWAYYMEALYNSRQYREAISAGERVRKDDPKSTKALQIIAHSNFETRQYDNAIAAYNTLKQNEPLAPDDRERLAKAYTYSKKDSLAIPIFEALLREDTSRAELYYDLGTAHMRLRNWEAASIAFEKRFQNDPEHTGSLINYGLCTMTMGRFDSARVALRRVVELRSDYLPGHLYLARCLGALKDSSQATIKEYETVIALADTAVTKYKAELAEAHGRIGVTYLVDKKLPLALEALNTSIKYRNDDPVTRLWRAQCYALMNRREEAVAEYRVVLKLDPKNKTAKENLASLGVQ